MNQPEPSMNEPIKIEQNLVLPSPIAPTRETEQVLSELANTFQDTVVTLGSEIKASLSEGRVEDTAKAVGTLRGLANDFMAKPLLDLCDQLEILVHEKKWTELLNHWVPRLETAIQAAVSYLRDKDLLEGSVSLPAPVHTPQELSNE